MFFIVVSIRQLLHLPAEPQILFYENNCTTMILEKMYVTKITSDVVNMMWSVQTKSYHMLSYSFALWEQLSYSYALSYTLIQFNLILRITAYNR